MNRRCQRERGAVVKPSKVDAQGENGVAGRGNPDAPRVRAKGQQCICGTGGIIQRRSKS